MALWLDRQLSKKLKNLGQTSDIDSDFGVHPITNMGKDAVIEYIRKKYGDRYVAHVGNRLEYQPKSVLRDLGQVYEIPSAETVACTKEYNDELTVRENINASETVKAFFDKYPALIDKVDRIIGCGASLGVHAGGIIISNSKWPLDAVCPLQKTKENGKIATLWTKDEIQKVGLIKYDILGVSSVAQIHYAKELLGLDPYIDSPEEPEVFQDIVMGLKNRNIFQFESEIGKKAFEDLMPQSILELANASGIIRILGSESGRKLYDEYKAIVAKQQTDGDISHWKQIIIEETVEPHVTDAALKAFAETYGVLIYQEQLANFINYVSGGQKTFAEGNICRKKLEKFSKKFGLIDDVQGKPHAIKEWHKEFMKIIEEYILPYLGKDGLQSENKDVKDFLACKITKEENQLIVPQFGVFKWLIGSAAYLFNKLHAIAYSVNSYNAMWLKHHAPAQFWLSSLLCEQGDVTKIRSYISAIRSESPELTIVGPDVNKSQAGFILENETTLRFGLGAINGVGKAAEEIYRVRCESGNYTSFTDFLTRVNRRIVNKAVITKLLFLDAFSSLGSRDELVKEFEKEIKEEVSFPRGNVEAAILEGSLIGANLTYEHPVISKAMMYVPLDQFEDGWNDISAIRILGITAKLTKKGKPYQLIKAECLNCGKTVSAFDWQNNKNLKENDCIIARMTLNGNFWQLCGESSNQQSIAAQRAAIYKIRR